jgi:RHS Repeat
MGMRGTRIYTTAADGGRTVYGYSAEGLMTSVTDPLGHTTAYAYDADLLCRDRSASDFFILSGAQNLGAMAQAQKKSTLPTTYVAPHHCAKCHNGAKNWRTSVPAAAKSSIFASRARRPAFALTGRSAASTMI